MDQLSIAIPKRSPLGALCHAVIGEIGKHLPNRIGKNFCRLDGAIERIDALIGELQFAKDDICRRGELTFELGFNRQGDVWRECQGGGVRDLGGVRDAWGE